MKSLLLSLIVVLLAPLCFAQDSEPAAEEPREAQDIIYVCPIEGPIDDGVAVVVERAVKEANAAGAKAIFFDVDTPGGRVDSAVKISDSIQGAEMTTVAFIKGMGAISAGALISFSCDHLFMTPGTNIGAATPVIPTAEGMQPTGEKETSFMRAKMRALAEAKGHNPDVAQAMVDKDIELRGYTNEQGEYIVYATDIPETDTEADSGDGQTVRPEDVAERIIETLVGRDVPMPGDESPADGEREEAPASGPAAPGTRIFEDGSELVLAKGKLLTLTPKEAEKLGVCDGILESHREAQIFLALGHVKYHTVEPSWAESLYKFLTNPTIAGLLLMLGIGGLYFEVRTPGFGLPGMVGITALTLLFGAHYVLGLTDVADILLVMIGIGLIAVEVFLIPGFGIAGLAGMAALLAGIYLSLLDFTIPEYSWQFDRLGDALYSLLVAFVSYSLLGLALWKFLPRTPLYGKLVLAGTQNVADGYVSNAEPERDANLGKRGVTTSTLRPAGRGRFDGKTLDLVARGDYIEKGSRVEIVGVDVTGYVVDVVKEDA